ncbi:unnamed protein product [Peniophora sp. CBMAI 1063]|nr:unnamed protein product [Peniophora sp. CBMAI 1063]
MSLAPVLLRNTIGTSLHTRIASTTQPLRFLPHFLSLHRFGALRHSSDSPSHAAPRRTPRSISTQRNYKPHRSGRSCTCGRQLSSEWYIDRESDGQPICSSCYAHLRAQKRNLSDATSCADCGATSSLRWYTHPVAGKASRCDRCYRRTKISGAVTAHTDAINATNGTPRSKPCSRAGAAPIVEHRGPGGGGTGIPPSRAHTAATVAGNDVRSRVGQGRPPNVERTRNEATPSTLERTSFVVIHGGVIPIGRRRCPRLPSNLTTVLADSLCSDS